MKYSYIGCIDGEYCSGSNCIGGYEQVYATHSDNEIVEFIPFEGFDDEA